MSSSLTEVSVHIVRVVLPAIIIISIIGNSCNIAVLTRHRLYNHACSRYFIAVASNNLSFTLTVLVNALLTNVFSINLSNISGISCRTINYLSTLMSFLSPYFIVLASIDRYCASSTNVHLRNFSSIRVSQWMIFICITFFALLFIHIIIFYNLQSTNGFICVKQTSSLYGQIYIITQVFLYAAIPPCLMIIFGLLTIHNTKRPRIVPVIASQYNRTEQQLARMLFFQVSIHVLLTLPGSVIFLILSLPNTISTKPIFLFALSMGQLLFYCSYTSSFFLYLLSGRIYREELFRLIYKLVRIRYRRQNTTSINGTVQFGMTATVHPQSIA